MSVHKVPDLPRRVSTPADAEIDAGGEDGEGEAKKGEAGKTRGPAPLGLRAPTPPPASARTP